MLYNYCVVILFFINDMMHTKKRATVDIVAPPCYVEHLIQSTCCIVYTECDFDSPYK